MNIQDLHTRDRGAERLAPGFAVTEATVPANVTVLTAGADGACYAGLGDGSVVAVEGQTVRDLTTHDGAVTGLGCSKRGEIISSGQDGSVQASESDGQIKTLRSADGTWITALAVRDDVCAYAAGTSVSATFDKEIAGRFDDHPSTVTGLAIAPNLAQVAVSHYNGVTLWSLTDLSPPLRLNWAGSIVGVSWSPDGRYIVAATQDRELHVWDLATERDYRLGGFQTKVKSIGWTGDSSHFYASGADVVVAWPLAGEPNAIPPKEIGYAHGATISAVAPLGAADAIAAGYSNGSVILGEVKKGTAKVLCPPGTAAVTAIVAGADQNRAVAHFGRSDGVVGTVRSAAR